MLQPFTSSTTAPIHRQSKRPFTLAFEPADEVVFQRGAIRRGQVVLTPVLANGTTLEPVQWRVRRLRPESSLRGNILSRKDFRAGVLDERVVIIRATLL